MKISEVIQYLEDQQTLIGDVQLYQKEDDGRCTYSMHVDIKLKYEKIWKGHPEPAHWYVKL